MSPLLQTIVALAIVGLTIALLVRAAFKRRQNPGCSSGGACGAISSDVRKLRKHLKSNR